MAQIPTQKETKQIQTQAKDEFKKKLKSQKKLGKDFVRTGAGVIPEDIWKNLPGKQNG